MGYALFIVGGLMIAAGAFLLEQTVHRHGHVHTCTYSHELPYIYYIIALYPCRHAVISCPSFNYTQVFGRTALHYASHAAQTAVITLLLDHGADAYAVDTVSVLCCWMVLILRF